MTIVSISIAKYSSIINVRRAQNVKNTMIDRLLGVIAPHYCYGCSRIGPALCHSCINNIIEEPFVLCAVCVNRPAKLSSGICSSCRPPYSRAWIGGAHVGALDDAIDGFKFTAARGVAYSLVELMTEVLPCLPENAVLISIPTTRRHIRERGFDHMKLFTKQLSRKQGVSYDTSLLCRRTATVQRGSSSKERQKQAKEAFLVRGKLDENKVYVLVDDVMTTGATLRYAAQTLRDAGAKDVWVIAIARQVLPSQ